MEMSLQVVAQTTRCVFEGNRAAAGGAVHVLDVSQFVDSGSLFLNNSAYTGGALSISNLATGNLSWTVFEANRAGALAIIANGAFNMELRSRARSPCLRLVRWSAC